MTIDRSAARVPRRRHPSEKWDATQRAPTPIFSATMSSQSPHFPSLEAERLLDLDLLPKGFTKQERSVLPHADYFKRLETHVEYVSLTVERNGTGVDELPPEFWADPLISITLGLNSAAKKVVIELPLCLRVRHSAALTVVDQTASSLHWLHQIGATAGIWEFVKLHPTYSDDITSYSFLVLEPYLKDGT